MFWATAAWGFEPVRTTETITIDGRLDEAIWQTAPITGFVQQQPVPGEADRGTRAWVAVDDTTLYVAFDARTEPGRRQSNALSPRDRVRAEDTVGILLDTFRDGTRAFFFLANGRGIQGDGIYVDGESDLGFPDLAWDGVLTTAGRFEDGQYTVEMAIPFRSLRFPDGDTQTWNVLLVQHVPVPWSDYTWPTVDPDAAGVLVQAAQMGPFTVGTRPGRIELLPTLTGFLPLVPADAVPKVDPGFGGRFAITTGLAADLAVNPDFSQIESDAGQVSANVKFPLFFPERRPFFLENADLFFTPVSMLNTRSIVDPIGGAKVTGRVGRLGIGFVGAVDEAPAASTISQDYATGAALPTWGEGLVTGAQAVDHVVRLRGDVGDGDTLGVLFSDKELLVPRPTAGTTEVFANRVGAVDFRVTQGRFVVRGQALGSVTDLPGVGTKTAPAWALRVDRRGERLFYWADHGFVARDFRAENGFLTEVGRIRAAGGCAGVFRGDGVFRRVQSGVEAFGTTDTAGQPVFASVAPIVDANLGERLFAYATVGLVRERFSGVDFDLWYTRGAWDLQPASSMFVGVGYSAGTLPHYAAATPTDLYQGFDWSVSPNVNFDALGRLNVSAQVALNRYGPTAFGPAAYATAIPRLSALFTFHPRWSLRWIEQLDSSSSQLSTSLLGAYVINYGTTAFFGYTDATVLKNGVLENNARAAGPVDRTLFAKISYLARL